MSLFYKAFLTAQYITYIYLQRILGPLSGGTFEIYCKYWFIYSSPGQMNEITWLNKTGMSSHFFLVSPAVH